MIPTIRVEAEALQASFRVDSAAMATLLRGPVMANLTRRALRVEAAAKGFATGQGGGPQVRTGRLRASITWRPGADAVSPYVDIGSGVHYCIFGGNTTVTTQRGRVGISNLYPSDYVLTQSGDFQRVSAWSAFPAVERPDLVDLIVPWRADRSHRLTVTIDHKVLCFRDGRNQWIMAGDLRGGDLVYDRVKVSHNRDTGPLKTCEWCEKRHRGQGDRYCSIACRDAHWAVGANPHLGAIRSEETRAKLSARGRERHAGLTLNRRLAELGFETKLDRQVADWLESRGVAFERQVSIGDFAVDFFLPEKREIVEADGGYWHRDQSRDIERDKELLRACPGVEITHIHFYDKARPPFEPIDPEPLPGVRYVVCNPGPESFVDPAVFRQMPVTIGRHWRYGENLKPKGSAQALLYDIAVESVQSFLAGGIIVSNSPFVEEGHRNTPHVFPILTPGGKFTGQFGYVSAKPTRPYPFLRPAISAARSV